MLTTNELLNGLPSELTLRFFATFARFEFAMKQCGCLVRFQERSVADASRRRLAQRLPPDFLGRVKVAGTATTLVQQPPRNLLVRPQGIAPAFGDPAPEIRTNLALLDAVWQVRNNLFHGNKMYPTNRERDQALMQGALAVLDLIMVELPDIAGAFEEPQQFF